MNQLIEKNRIQTLISDSENLLIFGIIIVVTIIVVAVVRKYLQKKLEKKAKQKSANITSFSFILHVVTATIYLFGFGWALLSLPISATFAHSLFAGAGASTLILGFTSHQVLSNVMSGVFLILKRSFKINDMVEIQGHRGKVIELNLHDTIIEDEEKNKIIIPNSLISNGVIKNIKNN
jgi:small-conductance mechanosensitive channel